VQETSRELQASAAEAQLEWGNDRRSNCARRLRESAGRFVHGQLGIEWIWERLQQQALPSLSVLLAHAAYCTWYCMGKG
jgi:hypothetical protein